MSKEVENVTTPVGDLEWIFITGKGKKDQQGNDRFVASVVLDKDSVLCKEFINDIDSFWDTNKPKKVKEAKSRGYRHLQDEENNDTGRISFNFWTGTTFQDGQAKEIKVFNAKGAEVALGTKKIGNGSRGRIKGAMGIYDTGPGACGVTLYLNGIQLTKFIEFTGGVSFDEVEDGDEDFEGFDEDGMNAINSDTSEESVPRL